MKRSFYLLCMLSLALLSCKKSENVDKKTTASPGISGDYANYAVGVEVRQILGGEERFGTMDTVVTRNQHDWLVYVDDQSDTIFFRNDGYYQMAHAVALGFDLRLVPVNPIFGESWEDVGNLSGGEARLEKTVSQVGASHTVEGTTYNDVVILDGTAVFIFNGSELSRENYKEYYSKRAGLIESTLSLRTMKLISRTYVE